MDYFYIGIIITLIVIIIILITYLNHPKPIDSNDQSEEEFIQVLNAFKQSILLFDQADQLIFYNKHAKDTLKFKNLAYDMHYNQIFENDKVSNAFFSNKGYQSFDIDYEGKIYLVNFYPVTDSPNKVKTIIILNNVTEAREIEQTKKDFFSNASHELKSPLTAIIGYSELVTLKMVEDTEYSDIITRIYNQALLMSLLVEDMAILSRLETITDDVKDRTVINLDESLRQTLYTLEPFIQDKNIEMVIKKIESIKFRCIPLDINKLFKNLIENAIKYSSHNTRVEVSLFLNDNEEVEFIVKDSGVGIAKEHVNRIFERFYRVDKGRIEPGTGLGLAIVKHTVLKYQGTVLVDSIKDLGTTITIKLPITK